MSSWLKAAEDLFEVVDRRAKLVVSELADEQSGSQPPASNVHGSQSKKTKLKKKAQKRLPTEETLKGSDSADEQTSSISSQANLTPEKDGDDLLNENDGTPSGKSMVQTDNEQQQNFDNGFPTSDIPTTETSADDMGKDDASHDEVPVAVNDAEAVASTSNGEHLMESPLEVHEDQLSVKGVEVVSANHLVEDGQSNKSEGADVPPKVDQERSDSINTDAPSNISNTETQPNEADVKVESPIKQKKQHERKAATSARKVQEQLDEAQGLLKTAISTGQSKEARLAKVCAGLSSRLQEYKSENAQLEELLFAERELSKSYEAQIKQLQQDLSVSKSEVTRVESNMIEALAAKNSEIEALVNATNELKKKAALSEGNLASLQVSMESMKRNRELAETRMMQALREELAAAERRAEEEHAAHNATKMAFMEREVELEQRAIEGSTALARIQRIADERTAKAADLEQKVALLEVECANLNQELQDMEDRVRRGQKKSPEDANQVIQMQAWQEEVERARQGQRDAESKLSSMEAEVQKMRVEMAAMKRDAEHYSRQEHMELEKRYRELTDLLYYKQTQLETMASEKAAAEFQLEKELNRLQEVKVCLQVEAERSRVSRRGSSSWEEDTEMKALDPLPLHHRHMAGASIQLQKAAKLLDTGAVRATRFLWRYPIARVILLFYLVFVHLFLMYLLHRLQEQADNLSAREVAESMGLATPNLP
ncbi:golgin candidate 1 isoform X1 [Ziziphus jujuba]|uniref:Golgin candidate 1 isoform X1 n=1 Tax=Ziziphus jujuba TaxID=326968 RepID=A0ABM3I5U2_ZIZJJ|nr:golgin candidate 1 isoform X1 [Ziziphus jujuba]